MKLDRSILIASRAWLPKLFFTGRRDIAQNISDFIGVLVISAINILRPRTKIAKNILRLLVVCICCHACRNTDSLHAAQSETATAYFVDAVEGDDSNAGTSEEPFETYLPFIWTYGETNPDIGKIQLQSGDEVVFRRGLYSATYQTPDDLPINQYRGCFLRNIHGTVSNPIIIRGEPGAILDAIPPQECQGSECISLAIQQSSNIEITGLEFSGLGRAITFHETENIQIHGNWIHNIDGTDNGNMEPLHLVSNSGSVEIFNNLLHDNFDRTNADTDGQKTENSRHIGFYSNHGALIRVHHNYVFNTDPITAQFSGSGIVTKHAGDAIFEVDHNVISRVWGSSVGSNNPNSFIHRNLILESDEIVVKDFGGRSLFNNIVVSHNTMVNADGILIYRPNDHWYPFNDYLDIGSLEFKNNLAIDESIHNGENGTLSVCPYVEQQIADKVLLPGNLCFEGNHYSHAGPFRTIWFVGLPSYELLDFAQWQNLGFDQLGAEALTLDSDFLPNSSQAQDAGWYSESGVRLTLFATIDDQVAIAPTLNRGESVHFRLVRSGESLNLNAPMTVTFQASITDRIQLPAEVTFLPGQRVIEIEAQITNQAFDETQSAVRVSPLGSGTSNNVDAWVRINNSETVPIGDVNSDGVVDLLDVGPFVSLILNGNFQNEADVNQDGVVDLLDVAPFVNLLTD